MKTTSNVEADREQWVDYAKGIGIILVVYAHVARGAYEVGISLAPELFILVDSIIYSFHMPLFFFLSGLFFHDSLARRGTGRLILSKLDTIIYPYIVWSLLQGSIEAVMGSYTNSSITVAEVLSFPWAPRGQFWFLYALFLLYVLFAIVFHFVRKSAAPLLLPVAAVLFIYQRQLSVIPQIEFICANAIFFAMGINSSGLLHRIRSAPGSLFCTTALLFVIGQYVFHVQLGLSHRTPGALLLSLATVSIFFVVSVAMLLQRHDIKWLAVLGASSMTIYLMHILAGSGTRILLHKVMHLDSVTAHLILGTLCGLLLPLIAEKLIYRLKLGFLLRTPRFRAKIPPSPAITKTDSHGTLSK